MKVGIVRCECGRHRDYVLHNKPELTDVDVPVEQVVLWDGIMAGYNTLQGQLAVLEKEMVDPTAKKFLQARMELYDHMVSMSQKYYSAGWELGLEYKLWSLLNNDGKLTDKRDWDRADVDRLRALSSLVRGWWRLAAPAEVPDYDDGCFVDLDWWLAAYRAWQPGITSV